MKASLTFAFALLLICTGTGAALAQTPDGDPPSEETVCDGEAGAAYGLCNAYCEAMDCDSDDPSASETACSKVQSKFQNITGRDIPCEVPAVTCPCASLPNFNEIPELPSSVYCSLFEGGVSFGSPTGFTRIAAYPAPENTCRVTFGSNTILSITPEEAALCIQLILDIAASKNVTCL